jgi:hypothetical protein
MEDLQAVERRTADERTPAIAGRGDLLEAAGACDAPRHWSLAGALSLRHPFLGIMGRSAGSVAMGRA